MPEGHTIHALATRLNRAFAGRTVGASSPQGRFAGEAAMLDGHLLVEASAVGKHLFVTFDEELLLHVHLGLIGHFAVRPVDGEPPPPVGAVRLRLLDDGHLADLRGPMICALISPHRKTEVVAALGPDPLDPAADGERAWRRIHHSGKPIAELLMNQSFIAGVGNVYRCEVLHRHAIDPMTPGNALSREAWETIWQDLVELLRVGVVFSQILTMDDQLDDARRLLDDGTAASYSATLTGERLGDWFERRFHTYQRTGEACLRCGSPIRERQIAGRTLYWCSTCQRRR